MCNITFNYYFMYNITFSHRHNVCPCWENLSVLTLRRLHPEADYLHQSFRGAKTSEDMSLQCPSVAPTDCIWETEALSHLFLLPVHLHYVCLSAPSLNNSVCQKDFGKWFAQVREEGNALMELRKLDTCTHILYTAMNWTPDDLYY